MELLTCHHSCSLHQQSFGGPCFLTSLSLSPVSISSPQVWLDCLHPTCSQAVFIASAPTSLSFTHPHQAGSRVVDKRRTDTALTFFRASLVAQMVKRLPAIRETQVQSPGQEDALEKEMATHSSTVAWKIPWTEEPGRLQSMGSQRVRHD